MFIHLFSGYIEQAQKNEENTTAFGTAVVKYLCSFFEFTKSPFLQHKFSLARSAPALRYGSIHGPEPRIDISKAANDLQKEANRKKVLNSRDAHVHSVLR